MPKLLSMTGDDQVLTIPGTSFSFSAVRPEKLGATEYTLVTMVIDITGSVSPFAGELLKMVRTIVDACKKHPRSENLMVRFVTFNTELFEIHGFKPVADIDPAAYADLQCSGMTSLYDATIYAVGATQTYAKTLSGSDFNVNAAIYIVTDGADNASVGTKGKVKKLIEQTRTEEVLESLVTILIGINATDCDYLLQEFQKESELTQYVSVPDATPGKLAKLAGFISKSVSSTSQALGSGGPSQLINPTF